MMADMLAFGRAPDTKAWAVLIVGTALVYTGHAGDVPTWSLIATAFLGHDVTSDRWGQPATASATMAATAG